MTKPIIDAHPSLVIATNSLKNKLLLSVYDSGYRGGEGPYPLSANVIGGNPDIEYDEKGPRQVLEREIIEEFDPNFQLKNPKTNQFNQRVAWANPKDIESIRNNLLEGLFPLSDFYVQAKPFAEGTAEYEAIFSYFSSKLPDSVFEVAESNLRRQKALTPEGLVGVFTLDELENDSRGDLTTAHATAAALNYIFKTNLSCKEEIKVTPIGRGPRDSFADYLQDFEYSKEPKPNHNNPKEMDPSFHQVIFGKQ